MIKTADNVAYKDISHVQQEVEIETHDDNCFVLFESFAKLEARVENFENQFTFCEVLEEGY